MTMSLLALLVPRHFPIGKLQPLDNSHRPWSHLAIDFLTDLTESEGNTTIMVTLDRFSRTIKLIPLMALPTAFQTAETLFNFVFRHYGLPVDIISDRGPQFISKVWRSFMEKLGITVRITQGYHPQANNQVDRQNQEIGRFLRTFCSQNQSDWSRYVPWVEYTQNSLRHSATNLTPFQCVLGYQPPLFPQNPTYQIPSFDEWFHRSGDVWEEAHKRLEMVTKNRKQVADRHRLNAPKYRPGDSVWLSTKDL